MADIRVTQLVLSRTPSTLRSPIFISIESASLERKLLQIGPLAENENCEFICDDAECRIPLAAACDDMKFVLLSTGENAESRVGAARVLVDAAWKSWIKGNGPWVLKSPLMSLVDSQECVGMLSLVLHVSFPTADRSQLLRNFSVALFGSSAADVEMQPLQITAADGSSAANQFSAACQLFSVRCDASLSKIFAGNVLKLMVLDFSGICIGSRQWFPVLHVILHASNLQRLVAPNCGIDDNVMCGLESALLWSPHLDLTFLDVSQNAMICAVGGRALLRICSALRNLRHVMIAGTQLLEVQRLKISAILGERKELSTQ